MKIQTSPIKATESAMTAYGKSIVLAAAVLALSSCQSACQRSHAIQADCDFVPSRTLAHDQMSDGLRRYLKTCREEWMRGAYPGSEAPLEEYPLAHWECRTEYRIVYGSDRFVSYWADEWWKEDSFCGNSKLSVGTLMRPTGRRLHLRDLYDTPEEKAELVKAWESAVARGRFWYAAAKYNPGVTLDTLDHPFMTENFFIKGNEIHFIYQQGEVSANCNGAVEVVVTNWSHGILAADDGHDD